MQFLGNVSIRSKDKLLRKFFFYFYFNAQNILTITMQHKL